MSETLQANPLGPSFNFAQHLLERNAKRPDKTAFIDDQGRVSYGELALRVRRKIGRAHV